MEQSSFEQRYHRQLILPGFGPDAQQRLTAAKVLVIGAGGLGCPVLQYLVAAGIGHLAIADQDTVSLSNLQRQILYGESDLGQLKATVAKERLASLNSGVKLVSLPVHWTPADCIRYFPEYDIIVDATDNFATRYMINDAAVLLGKPVVYGSVSRYEGQVAVLNHLREDRSRSVNYRDLFPEMPQQHEVLTCAEAGVLGAVTGVIGSLQALEVIKVITQTGKPLTDALLTYNGLTQELFRVELQALESSGSTLPGTIERFLATDYHQLGDQRDGSIPEVSWEALQSRLNKVLLVDVRNLEESPRLSKLINDKGGVLKEIPLDVLSDRIEECTGVEVVFVCQSGVRSQQAVRFLRKYDPSLKASSVKGGVNAFVETKSAEYGR